MVSTTWSVLVSMTETLSLLALATYTRRPSALTTNPLGWMPTSILFSACHPQFVLAIPCHSCRVGRAADGRRLQPQIVFPGPSAVGLPFGHMNGFVAVAGIDAPAIDEQADDAETGFLFWLQTWR